MAEGDAEDPEDQVVQLAKPCSGRTRRAAILPLRLTERATPFVVDAEMVFEEAMMCALTLMLAIGIATALAFALSVLPSVSNLSLRSKSEQPM